MTEGFGNGVVSLLEIVAMKVGRDLTPRAHVGHFMLMHFDEKGCLAKDTGCNDNDGAYLRRIVNPYGYSLYAMSSVAKKSVAQRRGCEGRPIARVDVAVP